MKFPELGEVLAKYLFVSTKIGSTVVDVGCSTGWGSYVLAPLHVEVLGLDPIQENIRWAKSRLKNENLSYSQCEYWQVHTFGRFDAAIVLDTEKKGLDDESLAKYLVYLFTKTLENGGKLIFDYNERNESKFKNLFLAQKLEVHKEQLIMEVTFDFHNRLKGIYLT